MLNPDQKQQSGVTCLFCREMKAKLVQKFVSATTIDMKANNVLTRCRPV